MLLFPLIFFKASLCGGRYLAAAWIDSKYCFPLQLELQNVVGLIPH